MRAELNERPSGGALSAGMSGDLQPATQQSLGTQVSAAVERGVASVFRGYTQ